MAVDTEGARADMRIAHKYVDEWFDAKPNQRTVETLNFAQKYIHSARRKDPNVTLQTKLRSKELGLATLDALEANIYWCYGTHHSFGLQAIANLVKSAELQPMANTYVALSDAYIANNQRDRAIAAIHAALKEWPEDFELRKSLDRIEANPQLGINPKLASNKRVVLALGAVFTFVGLAGAAPTLGTYTNFANFYAANTGAMIFFGIGIFLLLIGFSMRSR